MRAERMTWDTHAAFNTLTNKHKFEKAQAEGVIKIIQDSREFDIANLVTKNQFDSAMTGISSEFESVRSEFESVRSEFKAVRSEIALAKI